MNADKAAAERVADQHWRVSYADGFRALEARFPVLLRRVQAVDPSEAEELLRSDHADAVAMVVRHMDAAAAVSSSSVTAHHKRGTHQCMRC